jgi:hypothetical protein
LPEAVASTDVKDALKNAYAALWALSEGTRKRQGITLPPKFNTDLIEVDIYVGTQFGKPNAMAFFTVDDSPSLISRLSTSRSAWSMEEATKL